MPVRESVSRPFRPTAPHGAPADMSDHTSTQRTPVGATALVFSLWLPFSCAYFMSYALRNINAVLAPELTHDFSLSASELGMLTSVFSLAFSLAQLPGGVMMDRYGARRVNASLLLLAAAGCGLFASGSSLTDRPDIVIGLIQCRADQIIHGGINDDKGLAVSVFHIDHLGQQNPSIGNEQTAWLENQLAAQITHMFTDHSSIIGG